MNATDLIYSGVAEARQAMAEAAQELQRLRALVDTKQTEIQRLNRLCDGYRTENGKYKHMVRKLNLLLADEKFDEASYLIESFLRGIDGPAE